jgi:5-bromo-4-chloroindolyl phosphate hydrolysis protein
MSGFFADDRNWIAAGIVAALLVPLLVFGAGLPFALGAAASAIVFAGLVFLLAPRRLFEGVDVTKIARGRLDLARKVLTDAAPLVDRLKIAAGRIETTGMSGRVDRLAETARTIIAGVEADPNRLASVQRFLTYYLPQAVELTENYAVLERKRSPDPARKAETEELIGKLDEAFSHYADTLLESDLADLDVQLRLLQSSLREDLGQHK